VFCAVEWGWCWGPLNIEGIIRGTLNIGGADAGGSEMGMMRDALGSASVRLTVPWGWSKDALDVSAGVKSGESLSQ
jgi:hypothetical protein